VSDTVDSNVITTCVLWRRLQLLPLSVCL